MEIIIGGKSMLDDCTSANVLRKFIPGMDAALETTKNYRQWTHDHATISAHGKRFNLKNGMESRHVASVPWFVMTALLAQEPTILEDNGRQFIKWLDAHPEYKVAG